MHDIVSHPKEIAEHEPGKKRKLIGDRGNYFLDRIQGEAGVNISACFQCEHWTDDQLLAKIDALPEPTL